MKTPQTNLKAQTQSIARWQLPKTRTGIVGLDEITHGGLPTGRPTLVCGNTGCGKTLLAMEFLVNGATKFDEPGVFISFEESTQDLINNAESLGFTLKKLITQKKIALDFMNIARSEIEATGDFDLEALFIRLGQAIDAVGAKRVVLDTIESLFTGLPNPLILRAELRRLFHWLKERNVTAIVTGESGVLTLSREGLEEYITDCVITLDHRVMNQVSMRRMRVVKYRGSTHGTNEYPFLIDENGISVLPITSLGLKHTVTEERISSGVERLDSMLGEKGYYRGSSVLISGTAGTGKSSFLAHFANAACSRGERVLFFAFEESPSQIIRNIQSIGIDLKKWVDNGLLDIQTNRPSFVGLETHLMTMHQAIDQFKPQVVILDPITSFIVKGNEIEVKAMLTRLVDFLKTRKITGMFSSLTQGNAPAEHSEVAISSLIDTWLLLRDIELGGERNRGLYILKSRGMPHSNQVREFLITSHGVDLCDVYVGAGGALTGAARLTQLAQEKASDIKQLQEVELRQLELERKRSLLDSKISAMRADFAAQEASDLRLISQEKLQNQQLEKDRIDMAAIRKADLVKKANGKRKSS